ncbi:MAG: hypothetical protein IID33_03455 [Planctomycetes bacterium]|nr:hypothetical protein [Planctomycetota bacterium]
MIRSALPRVWFPVALAALTVGGALLLAHPSFTSIDARDLEFYWARHYWMSAFNALSAACGVGLLHGGIDDGFSEAGRWALTAIGLTGAVLYLLATLQLFRRLRGEGDRVPSAAHVLGAFLVLQAVVAAVMFALSRSAVSMRRAVAAFASLGWVEGKPVGGAVWAVAGVSLLGALGWPMWLIWQARTRRLFPIRRIGVLGGVYVGSLIIAATAIALFEMPRRAQVVSRGGVQQPAPRSFGSRLGESLPLTIAASGAGMQLGRERSEPFAEGSKLVLAGVVLVGGLGGGAGGGITWPLLLFAMSGFGRTVPDAHFLRCTVVFVTLMLLLTLVFAAGLLLIETATGSPFQTPPTLADALLESASAIGGAGLTAGVTDAVTGANLSSGMHSPGDRYQYGVVWLMLAMLAGRLAPLWLLARLTRLAGSPTEE